ncbi:hypothetical protein CspeluHIS016_0206570 [Cutaneotrichosporon spelunceum]|uniref:Endonuclease/exonuclease/phosphatase domain-containing protein n=1 Tax=Cutaneotrichosporon spelunceum TaxID=1672016 RepID=A0AAD3TRH9_9TREE|nr:hypothetical protein CspeluHIS016_0206570 [Cutaneotrichosporon spelunceum]
MGVLQPDLDAPQLFLSASEMTAHPRDIHVATVNVRFDGLRHDPVPIPKHGAVNPKKPRFWDKTSDTCHKNPYREHPWAVRRSRLVDALLSTGSLPRFAHVGVGRDDGIEAGEYSPIFYDKQRFERVQWKTMWLSSRPEKPGSSQTRIATFLTLKDRLGGHLVHAVCTHYDDQGLVARAKSSLLIRTAIREWVEAVELETKMVGKGPKAPVLLFGDFNSPPDEDGYKNIVSFAPLKQPSFTFLDAYTHLAERRPGYDAQSRPYGPEMTWTGFTAPGLTETQRIDLIMAAADEGAKKGTDVARGGWVFTQYACLDNWIEEGDIDGWRGRWSDHRAVKATLAMRVARMSSGPEPTRHVELR